MRSRLRMAFRLWCKAVTEVDEWIEACKRSLLEDVKSRSRRAAQTLIINTPVRQHARIRNSFKASVNSVPENTDSGHGKNLDKSGQTALEAIFLQIDKLKLGDELSVVSDCPGAIELEEGGKNTPPARMVSAAVNQWSDENDVSE